MIKVRKFRPIDLAEFEIRKEDRHRFGGQGKQGILELTELGESYTMSWDNEILAVGGVVFYKPDFGEAWIACTRLIDMYPMAAFRAVKRLLDNLFDELGLNRLQATANCDRLKAQVFVEHLGFQREGRLRNYGPNKSDYYMYSRIR